jgi:hypothetical protein
VNAIKPLDLVFDELEAFATGGRSFSITDAQTFIDQTASAIRKVMGKLPDRCTQHLANASHAAAAEELPRFIHEIEAALMQAEIR